jgi:Fur family transcriptional regulator, ferric uptake regulator
MTVEGALYDPALPGPSLPGPSLPGPSLPGEAVPGEGVPGQGVPGAALLGSGLDGPTRPDPSLHDPTLHELVEQRLRQASQRYTRGRKVVIEVLAGAGHPVSIDDICGRAPRLPRSSAYRHLVELQQVGVVRRVAANDDYSRFELAEDITEHHHHLLCTCCGKVLDVTPTPAFEQAMARYLDNLASTSGFVGTDHRLDVLGTCATCRQAALLGERRRA